MFAVNPLGLLRTFASWCTFRKSQGKYDLYRDQTMSHIGLEEETVRSILANPSDVVSFYDDVAEAVCESRGASVFVDKQPWPPRWYRLWYTTAKFEKARWIHLLRDGRDCYRSAQSHPPAATTRGIMRFVGLPYEPEQIDASSRENYDEEEQRVHSRLREPITDSSVGRWRQELDPEEVTNFHR
jgi:hypothetical protein